MYSVSYPLFRETSTLSLCVWVRLLVYGRLRLDPFFALVVSMAHRRLQLDPAFCPGSFNGSREITTRSLSCPGPFSGSREITTRSLFALVRSAVLGRLQLDPLSRLTLQGRLQLDPFFALRIARPFLDYCASGLCLPHFNYFAHRCFVFPLFLVSLYPLDCFLSPPLSSRFFLS